MLIDWILCFLGIYVYFVTRYQKRNNKKVKLSFSYWIQDNWPELSTTIAFNVALMIIIHLPETIVDLAPLFEGLPFYLKVASLPTLSFLLGLGLTGAFYSIFKAKTKGK